MEILEEYKEKYPKLIKIYSKENGGQASARNLGIEMASGEYIGFADSDDYVDKSMFEKMLKLAKKENADLVECHYHSMLETGDIDADGEPVYKEIGTRGKISSHKDVKELFIDPQVSPWNKLYKKEVLVNGEVLFPEKMIYEDTSFYIKLIPFIQKHAYLDEKLVYYSVRQNSTMTSNTNSKVGDIFNVFEDVIQFYKKKNLFEMYKDELEYFCVKIAFCSNLSRIGRVSNTFLRHELYGKTFNFVEKSFPDYRENKYFNGKIGAYIKSVNRFDCGIYAKILSKVMVG